MIHKIDQHSARVIMIGKHNELFDMVNKECIFERKVEAPAMINIYTKLCDVCRDEIGGKIEEDLK